MAKFGHSALAGPALGSALGNNTYLAWADRSTHRLMVMDPMLLIGSDHYDNTQAIGSETTFAAPALAGFRGKLVIAWTGEDGGHHLNVMASPDGKRWGDYPDYAKQTLPYDVSDAGPSLAAFGGRLYLAYTGQDTHLYLIPSDDGIHFHPEQRIRLAQTSIAAPSIAARGGEFFLVWTGTDSKRKVNYVVSNGVDASLDISAPLEPFASPSGPTVSVDTLSVVLMYRGFHEDHFASMGAGGGTYLLGSQDEYADTSRFSPAYLLNDGGWVAWTGMDGDQSINFSGEYLMEKWPA